MLDKELVARFEQLSDHNQQVVGRCAKALLAAQEPAVVGQNTPYTNEECPTTEGATWLEWRWVRKPSGRKCGPYLYEYGRVGGKKKLVKYHGKASK